MSNSGHGGPDDHVGTANFITPEKLRAAAALVRKGKSFSPLAFPRCKRSWDQPDSSAASTLFTR